MAFTAKHKIHLNKSLFNILLTRFYTFQLKNKAFREQATSKLKILYKRLKSEWLLSSVFAALIFSWKICMLYANLKIFLRKKFYIQFKEKFVILKMGFKISKILFYKALNAILSMLSNANNISIGI